jgi:hypothetical protein
VESSLYEFRSFIFRIRDTAEPGWGEAEIVPWLEQHSSMVAELHEFGQPEARSWQFGPADADVLWDLYAMSRLVDILLGPHQPIYDGPALLAWTKVVPWWTGPSAARSAWDTFRTGLRATTIAEDRFHPFFHEIVAVDPSEDPDEPITLVAETWPGALVGSLLLARSGVVVRGGSNVVDPEVASRSCLYWAWWRRNRVVGDLSHGWGHNSQWRTDFRRDYVVDDRFCYNVDAPLVDDNPADHDEDLTAADRLDLLRFRHSVRRDLGHDRWPYYDSHVENRRA